MFGAASATIGLDPSYRDLLRLALDVLGVRRRSGLVRRRRPPAVCGLKQVGRRAALGCSRIISASSVVDTSSSECARTTESDLLDVRLAVGGDEQAYARLVGRYQQPIARQMRSFARDSASCEELVHDVFVEAYFSLASYRAEAPLVHWLRCIATRVGYRYWKRLHRQREESVDWTDPVWRDQLGRDRLRHDRPQASSAVDSELEAAEAADAVHAVLAHLQPRDRLLMTMLYLDGQSIAETAELCGWSQTYVRVQAYRARAKLRRLLERGES